MFSVLVMRLRSLRLMRVSCIVMRLRMFLLLITFLKAYHSFRNRLLVICKNAYLFATMIMTSVSSPFSFFFSSRRRHTRYIGDWSSDVCSSDLSCRNTGSRSNLPEGPCPHCRRFQRNWNCRRDSPADSHS